MSFIPQLAGLRGLAALMVFVAHAGAEGFLPKFISNTYGKLGLICFFILSGYLIAQVYLYKPFNKQNARNYLVARLARIVPLFIFIIVVSFIISNYIHNEFHYDFKDKANVFLSLLFIHTPHEPWTIPVEVQFYVCFLLFWYLYYVKKIHIAILFLFPIIFLIPTFVFWMMYDRIPHVMCSFAIFFFIGILISFLHKHNHLEKRVTKIPTYISWLMLFAFAVVFPVLRKKFGIFDASWYSPIGIFIVTALFILIIIKQKDYKILSHSSLIFMSEISYGFYLIHRPIMKLFTNNFGTGPFIALLILISSIALAYVSFKLIEVPARKYIERKLNYSPKTD